MAAFTVLVAVLFSVSAFCSVKKAVHADISMKINASTAQINLEEPSRFKVGQHVGVYREDCRGGRFSVCTRDRVGSAKISKIHSQKYAEVTMDKDIYFEEGYVIQGE
ncbi:hypothetical protein ACLVWU_13330 [Bdellovibrio sp. HCB290]|uniref:hypothetical protein n=1 Tax=Bdellovibrio sp. HCB290 TaxID=3394356 RepID=UPI0039B603A5